MRRRGMMPAATVRDVRRLCGDMPEWKLRAILDLKPDLGALEIALAWIDGDDEHTPLRYLAPHGISGRIYDIVMADEEFGSDERH